MFIPSSLRRAKRYTRYNLLVRLYPVYTWYKPRQAKLSNWYQIPDEVDCLVLFIVTRAVMMIMAWNLYRDEGTHGRALRVSDRNLSVSMATGPATGQSTGQSRCSLWQLELLSYAGRATPGAPRPGAAAAVLFPSLMPLAGPAGHSSHETIRGTMH